jgi:pyruvate, water dikinase
MSQKDLIKKFKEIGMDDLPQVGGKNASLGEMISKLTPKGVAVPDGFALTAEAYRLFLEENDFHEKLNTILKDLDEKEFSKLKEIGKKCRELIMSGELPQPLKEKIQEGFDFLTGEYGEEASFAARSSATAEDLPHASFAGQQETYLNVVGLENLFKACQRCYASLFTDRAIKYRVDNGFEHMQVALSVGIQLMVRSDKASAGVMFTIDPDSGFDKVTLISGAWGLGENVVQGNVNADEFLVFKPFLNKVKQPVISHKLGSKLQMMTYASEARQVAKAEDAVQNQDTPKELQQKFVLDDQEIIRLAEWAGIIEEHYQKPMDLEWAKDGLSGELFIVQARPETVHSQKKNKSLLRHCHIYKKGKRLCQGMAIGHCVSSGKARLLNSPEESDKLQKGEILVTQRTDPDWDPVLQKAGAIVTNQGGRTSHAAIVARELGVLAVVGTGDATKTIQDGQHITVSTAEGDTGYVYEGEADWDQEEVDTSNIEMPTTDVMLILGRPEQAFRYAALPNSGIGLMRMEFIINNVIRIHPMALRHFEELKDKKAKKEIEKLTHHYPDKKEYFIHKLAEATAYLAAAFYPKPVIVRMSDFKTNEYAELIGGKEFEPEEQNPMIGFRGASRYHHPLYREGFEMECAAMKMVREDMGFKNVKLMIPFCRTTKEAEKVIELMKSQGLERGKNELELYLMVEIPSNALLAEEFAKLVDGFSIGSNDLTQLTLGADRDSELLEEVFNPFDPAVMQLIRMAIEKARKAGVKIGLCGQAPSDYPEYARFLVECGINSISFNPDALLQGIKNIREAESGS